MKIANVLRNKTVAQSSYVAEQYWYKYEHGLTFCTIRVLQIRKSNL